MAANPAGSLVRHRVDQFDTVQAEIAQRPGRRRPDGPGCDPGASGGRKDPVPDLPAAQPEQRPQRQAAEPGTGVIRDRPACPGLSRPLLRPRGEQLAGLLSRFHRAPVPALDRRVGKRFEDRRRVVGPPEPQTRPPSPVRTGCSESRIRPAGTASGIVRGINRILPRAGSVPSGSSRHFTDLRENSAAYTPFCEAQIGEMLGRRARRVRSGPRERRWPVPRPAR